MADNKRPMASSSSSSSSVMSSLCFGCERRIVDRYLLKVEPNINWHITCLRCSDCGQQLNEFSTCFIRNGKAYCKQDYTRLFASRCSECHESFEKNDLVMKIQGLVFHMRCFCCCTCGSQLSSGDRYTITGDRKIICQLDLELAAGAETRPGAALQGPGPGPEVSEDEDEEEEEEEEASDSSTHNSVNTVNLEDNFAKTAVENGFRIKEANSTRCPINAGNKEGGEGGREGEEEEADDSTKTTWSLRKPKHRSSKSRDQQQQQQQKSTRVRTVLNERQLQLLRACYGLNPRPDALMKEQLVEMTGLSSRVIRVWFQNKRCKDKKRMILIRQIHHHQRTRDTDVVSLVAASPVLHDPSLSAIPVAVHQYQVPWTHFTVDRMHCYPPNTPASSSASSSSSSFIPRFSSSSPSLKPSSSATPSSAPPPPPLRLGGGPEAASLSLRKQVLTGGDGGLLLLLSDEEEEEEEDDSVEVTQTRRHVTTTDHVTYNGGHLLPLFALDYKRSESSSSSSLINLSPTIIKKQRTLQLH